MRKLSVPRNVLFSFLSWLLPLGFTFVLTPLIVHGLGAETYGLYALVMGFVAYSLTFNIGRTITKYIATYRASGETEHLSEVLSSTLALCLIVGGGGALLLVLCAKLLVTQVLNIAPAQQPVAISAFYLAAACLLLTMVGQVFSGVIQAVHRFDVYSYIATGAAILTISGNGLLVWRGHGAVSLLAWNVFSAGFACLLYLLASRRLLPEARFTFRLKKSLLGGMLKFSSAVIAYQILGNLLLLFERSWLTRTLGSAAVTFYVVPMTISIYIHAFISSLTLVIFPLASEAGARQDTARLLSIYTRAYKYVSVLVLFLVITLVTGSHQILSNWMGAEFAQKSSGVLVIQTLVFGLISSGIIAWHVSDGLGHPGRNALLSLSWLIIAVPVMIWLTPLLGIEGMAYGRLASVLTVPVYVVLMERAVFGRFLWQFWMRTALILSLAGGIMAAVQWFLFRTLPPGWGWLIAVVALSSPLYFGLLWVMGLLDKNEREWLKQLGARLTNGLRPQDLSRRPG